MSIALVPNGGGGGTPVVPPGDHLPPSMPPRLPTPVFPLPGMPTSPSSDDDGKVTINLGSGSGSGSSGSDRDWEPQVDVQPDVIPFAPCATCPPSERLYRVVGTQGPAYTYADPGASKELIQEQVGFAGFVTSVLSPEAYGSDQEYKTITTADGRQVQVPWNYVKEARGEVSKITGSYPSSDSGRVTDIADQLRAGSWTPVLELPIIQEIASGALGGKGISAGSALSEMWNMLGPVTESGEIQMAGAAPFGLTDSQATKIQDWFQQTGQPEKAETFAASYVGATGHPTSQVRRSLLLEHDVFGVLKDYQVGDTQQFRLAEAIASRPESERAAFEASLAGYFGESTVATAALQAGLIQEMGTGEVTIPALGEALATGRVTEAGITASYGAGTLDSINRYCNEYGCGVRYSMGPPGSPDFSPEVVRPESQLPGTGWQTEGGGFAMVMPDGSTQSFGSYTEARDALKIAESEATPLSQKAYDFFFKGTPLETGFTGQNILATIQTPEFTLATAGLAGFVGPAASVIPVASRVAYGASRVPVIAGHALKWGFTPVHMGTKFGTGLVSAFKLGGTLGLLTTSGAMTYGALTTPPKVDPGIYAQVDPLLVGSEASVEDFYRYWTKEGSLREGVDVTEAIQSAAQVGAKPTISKEVWETLPPGIQPYYIPSERRAMAHEPGITGVMGRASEFLQVPVDPIRGSLPVAGHLAAGLYQWGAPLSLVSDIYPRAGNLAYLAMIPHGGPTIAAPIVSGAPPWAVAAGVGFFLLPGLMPYVGAGIKTAWGRSFGRIGRPEALPRNLPGEVAWGPKGPMIEVGGTWIPATHAAKLAGKPVVNVSHHGYMLVDDVLRLARTSRDPRILSAARQIRAQPAGGRILFDPATALRAPEYGVSGIPSGAPITSGAGGSILAEAAARSKAISPTLPAPHGGLVSRLIGRSVAQDSSIVGVTPITQLPLSVTRPGLYQFVTSPWKFGIEIARAAPQILAQAPKAIPGFTVAAMTVLPGAVGATTILDMNVNQFAQMNIEVANQMLATDQITQTQYSQLVERVQQVQTQSETREQMQQDMEQTVEETLTQEQQVQYRQEIQEQLQEVQQVQQVDVLEQLQEVQRQQMQQMQQQQQQQQQQQYSEEGYYDPILQQPSSPFFFPPPPFGAVGLGAGGRAVKGRKRPKMGVRWLMPGLTVHFPDPFGTGKLSYQIAKPRARKYGAREPRPSLGGLKV